ncbi:MAG: hypothetical protein EXS64_14725 [Candidatus Latescibacteria bacterium]|nr:hypothetical protein [Candidatus Latescibacterota bacterium]
MKDNPRIPLPRNRRILTTYQGLDNLSVYPISPEEYVAKIDYLSGTQVGVLQWCLGTVVAFFDSKVIESWGTRQIDYDFEHGFIHWLQTSNLQHLIRTGNDPLRLAVERGHRLGMQVWGSYRMNDGHHTYPGGDGLQSQFYIDHPEFRLPTIPANQTSAVYDWCHPEILEQNLAFLTDVAERYDVDGIDLDFSRGGMQFSSGDTKYRQEVVGGHVRNLRRMLDRVGKQKGRYIGLSAQFYCFDPMNPQTFDRTPWKGNIQSMYDGGADVRAWAREGWIDILVGQCRSASLYELEIGDWVKAVEGTDCLVMVGPGKPSRKKLPGGGQTTEEEHRAIASRLYAQGADGIAFYDYMHHGPFDLTPFRELSDPEGLRTRTKSYLYQIDLPRDLGDLSAGGATELEVEVADDVARAQQEGHRVTARLRLNVKNINAPDDVRCFWNGTEAPVRREAGMRHREGRLYKADTPHWHLEAFPEAGLIRKGKNRVRVETLAKYPTLKVKSELCNLELRIAYDEAMTFGDVVR